MSGRLQARLRYDATNVSTAPVPVKITPVAAPSGCCCDFFFRPRCRMTAAAARPARATASWRMLAALVPSRENALAPTRRVRKFTGLARLPDVAYVTPSHLATRTASSNCI